MNEISSTTTHPRLVVATPRIRTQQTAEPLARGLETDLVVLPGLRDLNYLQPDKANGTTRKERNPLCAEWWRRSAENDDYVDSGSDDTVESLNQFRARICTSLGVLAALLRNGYVNQIIAYAHGGVIAAAANIIQGNENWTNEWCRLGRSNPHLRNTQAVRFSLGTDGEFALMNKADLDLFPDLS